jgi:hypothetical protein
MKNPECHNFFENAEWNRKIIPEKAQLEASRALIEVLLSIDEKLEKICTLLEKKNREFPRHMRKSPPKKS